MVFYSSRLRRALPLCSSLLRHHFHFTKVISPIQSIVSTANVNPQTSIPSQLSGQLQSFRLFRSSTVSLSSRRQRFDEEREITEDTILFEGCDYNHWLITVDFPKENTIPNDEKIATYERIAAQVFGSMEEAKKRIYACSTTVYEGFQVECTEEVSEKFKDVPGVVFVLPDSYIDPVNKQYGGDKYINGEIIPMPPPISYMKRDRPRPPRNFGSPGQQRFERPQSPPNQQNFGPPQSPPHHPNFGPPQSPPHQPNFGSPQSPTHQQNFGPPQSPHQQNFGPPQSPPHQQNFGPPQSPPHQQNFGHPQSLPHQQDFGPSQRPPLEQNFGSPQNPPYQQNFGPPQNPPYEQNFGHPQNTPYQQHFGPPQNRSYQQNYGPPVPQHNHPPPPNAPPQQYSGNENFGFSDQGRR